MKHWRFKSYESGSHVDQPRSWYVQQDEGVRAYILGDTDAVSRDTEAPFNEFTDFSFLSERYAFLSLYSIFIDSRHVGMIGFWQPESQNFIVLFFGEIDDSSYIPLLEMALKLKEELESGKGETHDLFLDSDLDEFIS
jgi:hypothetical protein